MRQPETNPALHPTTGARARVVDIVAETISRFGRLWPLHAAGVLIFLIFVSQFYRPDLGFSELIRFGARFESSRLPVVRELPRVIEPGGGDDGQFYVQLAMDPLLRDPATGLALDDADYRAKRMFFSWTAYALGLGRPAWIVQVYALQNVVSWLLVAWILTRWLPADSPRRVAQWCACLFSPGMLWSVRDAMLDGPSLLLMAIAIVAVDTNRRGAAACVLALAGLGRETNLLAVGVLVDPAERRPRGWIRQLGWIAIAIAPALLWFEYVRTIYPTVTYASGAPLVPRLEGYIWSWRHALSGVAHGRTISIVIVLSLIAMTVQVLGIVGWRRSRLAWWRAGAGFVVLLLTLGHGVWEGVPAAYLRVLLPLTVSFNLLLPVASRWFWPIFFVGNLGGLQILWVAGRDWLA